MDPNALDDIRTALRQRAEADRFLGATSWPVQRELLRRLSAAAPPRPSPAPPAQSTPPRAPAAAPPPSAPRTAYRPPTPNNVPGRVPAHLIEIAGGPPVLDTPEAVARQRTLDVLNETHVRGCTKCGLVHGRTHTVFGQGNPMARIVFVGEGPGFEEDRSGLAFVGRAGQLLTVMIERGMGLNRRDVYICNVVKCRPPENRTPAPDEIIACSPYLMEQLRIIRPEVIVALGAPAAQTLLSTRAPIGQLRGRFHDFHPSGAPLGIEPPIPLMPTYHPAYLLRNPADKSKAWADLKLVLTRLGLPIPGAG
ncbi:MAG: uracil-DNA glycosylase [Phycisphaerae bacterium]|nr:uracil-DNA glycosylase [Phycisphaerae bacterium]